MSEKRPITKYTRFLGVAPIIFGIIAFIGLFFPLYNITVSSPMGFGLNWFELQLTSFGGIELIKGAIMNPLYSMILTPLPNAMVFTVFGYVILMMVALISLLGIAQIIRKDSSAPSIAVIAVSIPIIALLITEYIGFEGFFKEFMRFGVFTFFNLSLITISVGEDIAIYYTIDSYTDTRGWGLSNFVGSFDIGFYLILIPVILAIAFSIAMIIIMKGIVKKREKPETIRKIEQIVKVSDRVKLDMMRKTLKMTEEAFLERIYNWAERFNFKIDGDYLVINKETVDSFLNELDKQYSEWEKTETTREGKVE
jgi:hypothetical protein